MSSRTTSCSSTTLVLVTIHPQGGWARYISSGRMSSRTIRCSSTTIYHSWCSFNLVLVPHILREDGLATYPQGGWAPEQLVVLLLPWYLSPYILREDELVTHPQGGWALEQLVVLLLPWYLSPHILRGDELVTYPQGGWALGQFTVLYYHGAFLHISLGRMSSSHILMETISTIPSGRMSSVHILGEDELEY